MRFHQHILASMALLLALCRPVLAEEPSAQVDFSGTSVALGVGYAWGGGVLHFQGKDYPFTMRGLSIADVGYGEINGTGDVYNLKALDDFSGNYATVSAGASVAAGGTLAALENESGVKIRFHSKTQGLKVSLSGDSVVIQLKGRSSTTPNVAQPGEPCTTCRMGGGSALVGGSGTGFDKTLVAPCTGDWCGATH